MTGTWTWNDTTTGNWTTPTDWTGTSAGPPGSGTSGLAGDVIFIQGVQTQLVTLNTSVLFKGLGSALTINNALATLEIDTGGTLSLQNGSFNVRAGHVTLTASDATILAANVTLSGGSSTSVQGFGTISAIAAAGTWNLGNVTILDTGGALQILNTVSVNVINMAATIADGSSNALIIGADAFFTGANSVNFLGAGALQINGVLGQGDWTGTTTSGTLEPTLSGLVSGAVSGSPPAGVSVIELLNVGNIITESATVNSGTVVITNNGSTYTFLTNSNATTVDVQNFGATGIEFWMVCYAAGTRILTPRGEVAVEALTEGDTVTVSRDGVMVAEPIKWMGQRHLDLTKHPQSHTAAPIRIRAGAFGDNLPRRDLLVSPAHAIYVDGKLVPANLLINNMTIVQELATKAVTYYHVELERHGLILAEGLTSESYLDTGNRAFFSNAGLGLTLHPEFHVNAGLKVWEEDACAPLAIDAEAVAPIWRELAERAETLGYVPPRFTTTLNADVYLEANGRRLRPVAVAQGRHTFMLPAGASGIVLRSRSSAPADLDPLTGDWRPLGVAVRSMTLRHGDDHIVIPADHPALTQGWYAAEASNGDLWRWTAGNATIPVQGTAGPAMLDIEIGSTATYILTSSDRDAQPLAA